MEAERMEAEAMAMEKEKEAAEAKAISSRFVEAWREADVTLQASRF